MAGRRLKLVFLAFYFCYFLCIPSDSSVYTIIRQGVEFREWDELNSSNNAFTLRFFTLGDNPNHYLGIFCNIDYFPMISSEIYGFPEHKAVWVANRDNPIPDTSGMLVVNNNNLTISHSDGTVISIVYDYYVAAGGGPVANASATLSLLDDGNLVVHEEGGSLKRVLWRSFDYPTDTLLPGMKLGLDLKRGRKWSLTCWMSNLSPASGSLTLGADFNGTSARLVMFRGGNVQWVTRPWLDEGFIYGPYNFNFTSNEDEKYFYYMLEVLDPVQFPVVYPVGYIISGALFINCKDKNGDATQDACLKFDFQKSLECRKPFFEPNVVDRKRGYFHGVEDSNDGGLVSSNNMSLYDCQQICWDNCSCTAFTYTHQISRTSCTTYIRSTHDFVPDDKPSYSSDYYFFRPKDKGKDDLAPTMTPAASNGAADGTSETRKKKWWVWLFVAGGSFLLLLICYLVGRRLHVIGKENTAKKMILNELGGISDTAPPTKDNNSKKEKKKKVNQELQLFSFQAISAATKNFSTTNKLGEGGFGAVYKGTLVDGKDVAVKRLSRSSGQGDKEFKNEIQLIAKLQHKNLVRLLGCCIEKEEKLLVYEYMPNSSLDFFLFDPSRKALLNWNNRLVIIEGIAQGLLYLHKYSRLTVIHRDLKASNILLDDCLNPKISDFGLAKIFGLNECESNTSRVVGTRGYMCPEYLLHGIVSMKTDVFSFGVLLIEIISCKINNGTYDREHPLNLIGLAWELWKEGRSFELMDLSLEESCSRKEVIRCIHVGLLCVQDHASDRPSMDDVIFMITNENMQLPAPERPAFFIERNGKEVTKEDKLKNRSINKLTLSIVEAR